MFTLHQSRKTIAASLAAAAVASGLTLVGSVATAPAAEAATPIVNKGDILLPTSGDFITGAGIDKLDPVTRVRSRAASFGVLDGTHTVAAAPNGDFFVGNLKGAIVKVDGATGARTDVMFSFGDEFSIALDDLTVEADGKLIGLINEASGQRLVRFNGQGGLTVLSQGGFLGDAN